MSQASVISTLYNQRRRSQFSYSPTLGERKDLVIDLGRFDVEREDMDFSVDNFPYIRAALLDKHLEEMKKGS